MTTPNLTDNDPTAESRKRDHIDLALKSQVAHADLDPRFYYEPMLAAHPAEGSWPKFPFLGKHMRVPMWVSSMTGGTAMARTINHNLARACRDFGMGMGLGSCRSLLYSDDTLSDFNVRHLIGPDLPLYANLGIAQLELLIERDEIFRLYGLIEQLKADGLIVHVNPMQEWTQPEGDRFTRPPLETIETLLARTDIPLIVKEVGQGFGPESIRALLQLPLAAIDFAAGGGTNFAKLELHRADEATRQSAMPLAHIGHSAEQMVRWTNTIVEELGPAIRCEEIIISGGVQDYLDGYYLTETCLLRAVYGQASAFLRHAQHDYDTLHDHISRQVRGLEVARAYLRVR